MIFGKAGIRVGAQAKGNGGFIACLPMHKIVYGLTSDLPRYEGCSVADIGRKLRDDGNDGVFLKTLTAEWIDALHAAGLKVYASQPVFLGNRKYRY